jgi:hypothetical protein
MISKFHTMISFRISTAVRGLSKCRCNEFDSGGLIVRTPVIRFVSSLLLTMFFLLTLGVKSASTQTFGSSIPPGEPVLTNVAGVAVDGDGNIYAALRSVHQVVKFSPTGEDLI